MNKIAYQGTTGAHSHAACLTRFPEADMIAYPTFNAVFDAVISGNCDFGVLPVENSTAGRVSELHSILPKVELYIVGEIFQSIQHHLIGIPGGPVKTVYSHPQALMQCSHNLEKLGVEVVPFSNTALAAQQIKEWQDPTKAALASKLAADVMKLDILVENLQDEDGNVTVFNIFSKKPLKQIDIVNPVTTCIFTIKNESGGLYRIFKPLADHGINILKLESYIKGGACTSHAQFYMTVQGHLNDPLLKNAMNAIYADCHHLKILGSYSAAVGRGL